MKHFEFILNTKHHGFVFQCSTMKEVMDAAEEANESFNLGIDFDSFMILLVSMKEGKTIRHDTNKWSVVLRDGEV